MKKLLGILIDTETANSLFDPLMYDFALAVIDLYGNILFKVRIIISDVFYGEADLMKSAYYASKLPQYHEAIANGDVLVMNIWEARQYVHDLCKEYGISFICAHNARFDYRSTARTMRYVTKSRCRYFFPKNLEWWDTMKMAKSTLCKQKKYRKFCEEHGYTYGKNNQFVRATAEILYQYISKDTDFKEAHTALADVEIEAQILWKCFAQHKKMDRKLFAEKA